MLGTRPEFDRFPVSNGLAARPQKFAEKLSGRFFVSGVSGSFKKFDVAKYKDEHSRERPHKPLTTFQRKVDEEFLKESEKLQELENKINQIQKLKRLQHRRGESRQQRKLEYKAAVLIQQCYRRYWKRLMTTSADIIVNMLRAGLARQGVQAGSWAIRILRRFAQKVIHNHVVSDYLRLPLIGDEGTASQV
jgi:hypothetical protein